MRLAREKVFLQFLSYLKNRSNVKGNACIGYYAVKIGWGRGIKVEEKSFLITWNIDRDRFFPLSSTIFLN